MKISARFTAKTTNQPVAKPPLAIRPWISGLFTAATLATALAACGGSQAIDRGNQTTSNFGQSFPSNTNTGQYYQNYTYPTLNPYATEATPTPVPNEPVTYPNAPTPTPGPVKLKDGVRYWVDTGSQWAGVYYKSVYGNCIYGGVMTGDSNCQIEDFNAKKIRVYNGEYWVDTNPSWPGVYYKSHSGRSAQNQCDWGGTLSGGGNCQLRAYSSF